VKEVVYCKHVELFNVKSTGYVEELVLGQVFVSLLAVSARNNAVRLM